MMQGPAVTGGAGGNGQAIVPFRRATVERSTILPGESVQLGAAYTSIERTVEGTGFLYAIRIGLQAITSGNAATVAFSEDAPWNALGLITLRDPNGELVNVPNGFYLYLANLGQKNYANRWLDQSTQSVMTTGGGATGGSFTQFVDVLVATNRRDLTGLVGNQDRWYLN
jgi:hypothetical protein